MLLDRAIPTGGWNLGNPVVFGTTLRPLPRADRPGLAGPGPARATGPGSSTRRRLPPIIAGRDARPDLAGLGAARPPGLGGLAEGVGRLAGLGLRDAREQGNPADRAGHAPAGERTRLDGSARDLESRGCGGPTRHGGADPVSPDPPGRPVAPRLPGRRGPARRRGRPRPWRSAGGTRRAGGPTSSWPGPTPTTSTWPRSSATAWPSWAWARPGPGASRSCSSRTWSSRPEGASHQHSPGGGPGRGRGLPGWGAREVFVAEGQGHCRDTGFVLEQSGLGPVLDEAKLEFVDLNHDDVFSRPNRRGFTGLRSLHLPPA